ncbi:MAG: formate dehydrogenase beta subunit [Enterobacterales bacterium]
MKATSNSDNQYFHKVVDCQWACPAHTPVPEYIRQIAAGRYDDAYMLNWESNVFPGILGRVCDRPCEPACRRGRLGEEPVAICRLKRVAADNRGDISHRLPIIPEKNGKRLALIGAGPASLTVARDLMPLGYSIDLFDSGYKGGGMMVSQIPSFRLPAKVLDEEVDMILNMGVVSHFKHNVDSMKEMLEKNYDSIFVGTGAPKGRDIDLPGRKEAVEHIHIGIDWLASVAFEHVEKIGKKVIILGGGNTAMDCCRTSRRLGGDSVNVVVRSGYDEMKASPWEKEDALMEDVQIHNFLVPEEFIHEDGKLTGLRFQKVKAEYVNDRRKLVPTGEDDVIIECDDVLIAIGQQNSFPWIEEDAGIEFNDWGLPVVNEKTHQSSIDNVFFGGDSAFGPKNIIWAVEHGHQAAISIHKFCQGEDIQQRPDLIVDRSMQKMGMHEWIYDNDISNDTRFKVPHADKATTLVNPKMEVELGFDENLGLGEAVRCLNCDVQTIFSDKLCIECDACMDICPTSCITFVHNAEEDVLRLNLKAKAENLEQSLMVSELLKTQRVMVKDEDLCLHCGLCAERCPTSAWDMQKYQITTAKAGA